MNDAGVLGGILRRLDLLEQQARAPSGEQHVPTYLTTGPDGKVSAAFTGLVNALGLILPAGTGLPIGQAQAIRWQDANGAAVAQIYATDQELDVEMLGTDANPTASLQVKDGAGTIQARVLTTYTAGQPTDTEVQLLAGVQILKALDANGKSAFARLSVADEIFIDGPHQVSFPTIASIAAVTETISTARASWANAAAVGMVTMTAGGAAPTVTTSYVGGTAWNITLGNPWSGTLPVSTWTGYVVGV